MSAPDKSASKSAPAAERVKTSSRQLRGDLSLEILADTDRFSPDAAHIIKHHGVYQQDDRDLRRSGTKVYSCFVRTRMPSGILSHQQFLDHLELCDQYGNGTLRLTDRQGVQVHGIVKADLPAVIRRIEDMGKTSLGACGDVVRNVMCCPAPQQHPHRQQLQKLAATVSQRFLPQSGAFQELWLREGEESRKLAESLLPEVEEPLYGRSYLPRKFKIGFALPDDNCIDVLTHDLGFVAVVEQNQLLGFDACVGGGMGVTPARQDTFAAVAQPIAFVSPEQVCEFSQAVVELHRDYGVRTDRRQARIRYLIADWGLTQFREHLADQLRFPLEAPRGSGIHGTRDHLGWNISADGTAWLGLYVAGGRIQDTGAAAIKTALADLVARFQTEVRVTPHQNLLLCGLQADQQQEVTRLLQDHGVETDTEALGVRRQAMACPALPNCGLAITEAERVLPDVLNELQAAVARHGLSEQPLSIRMTGCPNGCARPYVAEIGIVGKARDRYTLYLGGCGNGTRLGQVYQDLVPREQLVPILEPILAAYARNRLAQESFGEYCVRTRVVAPLAAESDTVPPQTVSATGRSIS